MSLYVNLCRAFPTDMAAFGSRYVAFDSSACFMYPCGLCMLSFGMSVCLSTVGHLKLFSCSRVSCSFSHAFDMSGLHVFWYVSLSGAHTLM